VAFTQEMGCQISAFVPFDEPLHCESFFSFALHATSNVGIIFLLFSKKKKEQFQRTNKKPNRVAV